MFFCSGFWCTGAFEFQGFLSYLRRFGVVRVGGRFRVARVVGRAGGILARYSSKKVFQATASGLGRFVCRSLLQAQRFWNEWQIGSENII